ncbi:MarR family winged helix-turn-helix transcriptional regulator [Celeribacter neptunius]|uniref:Transcriptional regulator, MarR family n=1 Tax=Celeribacter neptunius TaxID=588602 RepID=A0A1I3N3M9_9RHOB|nr:MarR family transcriptional regulator [Celeribacter neptunius]SFJ03883.1 transcriptional regulator, MarR family [Celeribacter neptunius]
MTEIDRSEMSLPEQLYAGITLTRPLVRNITARVEQDLQDTGITVGQRAILEALLALGQATAPEITDALDVTRQFVGRELKSLLEDGKLETVENPRHKASKYYRLSPEARRAIEAIRAREMAEIAEFSKGFTAEEIGGFYKILTVLNREFAKTRTERPAAPE